MYLHKLKKVVLLCYLILIMDLVFSKPVLTMASPVWDENTKILVGNCVRDFMQAKENIANRCLRLQEKYSEVLDLIHVDVPKSKTLDGLSDYKTFSLKNKNRPAVLFMLSNKGPSNVGILYQLNVKTGQEMNTFVLPMPVQSGTLVQADVFYENDWRSVLVLTATGYSGQRSVVLLFDITDPQKSLQPFLSFTESELSLVTVRPVILRLSNGQFGIAMGGHLKKRGLLHIILLENPKFPLSFELNDKALSFLTAVDIYQQAVADKIYLSDGEHLWVINIAFFNQFHLKLLTNVKALNALIVVPNIETEGLRLYFLGSTLEAQGLFMIEDPSKPISSVGTPILIHKGDYAALFMRFGRLLVVPKAVRQAPLLLALPSHDIVPVVQQAIYSLPSLLEEVFLSKLLWDPKERCEVLLTLNLSCQLTIFRLDSRENQYGRIMWRKKNYDIERE